MRYFNTTIIVSHNEHRVIGTLDNKIPWRIPEDLKFFKEVTTGSPVIMGRLTWESLPDKFRPLPNRTNVVITKNKTISYPKDVICSNDLKEVIHSLKKYGENKEIFVIGGGSIYKHALDNNLVDRVLISEVKGFGHIKEGVLFPKLKNYGWKRKILHQFENFSVVEYKPILTYEKISEIAMDIALKLKAIGVGEGYERNECMNVLRSNLINSFAKNGLSHNPSVANCSNWDKIRKERQLVFRSKKGV